MHDVMRKRIWRKLEGLSDEQLYQVLDFIEFLESKYAPGRAPESNGLQRFAERLEDRMRVRAIAPRAMTGTMRLIGTAGRMLDNLTEAGQELLQGLESGFGVERRTEKSGPEGTASTSPRPADRVKLDGEHRPEGGR